MPELNFYKENPRKYAMIFRLCAMLCALLTVLFFLFVPFHHFGCDKKKLETRNYSETEIKRLSSMDVSVFDLLVVSLINSEDVSDSTIPLYQRDDWDKLAPMSKANCILGVSLELSATSAKELTDADSIMMSSLLIIPIVHLLLAVIALIYTLVFGIRGLLMLKKQSKFKPYKKIGNSPSLIAFLFTAVMMLIVLIFHVAFLALSGWTVSGLLALPLIFGIAGIVLDVFHLKIGKTVQNAIAEPQQK